MSGAQQQAHKSVAERSDSVDIERLIDRSGCAKEYYALEECMGEAGRVWSKCQAQVTALKLCNQAEKNKAAKTVKSSGSS